MSIRKIKEIYRKFVSDFDEDLYWKWRMYVQNHPDGGVVAHIRLMLLRRMESKKLSSTGLNINDSCCIIDGRLNLYHGLSGIIIAKNVRIGKNVTIFQHVTIAEDGIVKKSVVDNFP